MKKNIKFLGLILLFIFVVSLSACGAATKQYDMNSIESTKEIQDYDVASDIVVGSNSSVKINDESSSRQNFDTDNIEQKIIYTFDFALVVSNVIDSIKGIENNIKDFNGYILESNISQHDNSNSGYLRVKIPRENISSFVESLEETGNVKSQKKYAEDVSTEYYDIEARLAVLLKQEARLLSFMDEYAKNIEDLLALEREISSVRAERESLQARMNYLQNSISYSEFSIYIEQSSYGELTAPKGTFGKAYQGLLNSLNQLIHLFNWMLIASFVILPYIFVLTIIIFIIKKIFDIRKSKKSDNS